MMSVSLHVVNTCIMILMLSYLFVGSQQLHSSVSQNLKNRHEREVATSQRSAMLNNGGNQPENIHSEGYLSNIENTRNRLGISTGIGNQQIRKIQRELLTRLGLNMDDLKNADKQTNVIPPYIQSLYENMALHDNDIMLRTNGQSKGSGVTYMASIDVYRHISVYEKEYRFDISSLPTDAHITKSEFILYGLDSTVQEVNVTYTTYGDQQDRNLTFRNSSTENTIIADITDIIIQNNTLIRENISFRIDSATSDLDPLVAIFQDTDLGNLTVENERSKRSTNDWTSRINERYGTNITRNESTMETAESLNICRLKLWKLRFAEMGWGELVHAPDSYSANLCVGNCPPVFIESYLNSSNYAFVKNLYHVKTNFEHIDEVPEACCSPQVFAPQSILYQGQSRITSRRLVDMRVTSCGCR